MNVDSEKCRSASNAIDNKSFLAPFLLRYSICDLHECGLTGVAAAMEKLKTISKAKLIRLYTLDEARSIKGPFIYALSDLGGIFYVGKTIDANKRFYRYARHAAPRLQRRLKESGDEVRLTILRHNPPDLKESERHFIGLHSPNLVNIQGSERLMTAKMPLAMKNSALRTQLSRCAGCGSTKAHTKNDPCAESPVELLNPLANTAAQDFLFEAGMIREKFSLPPKIVPQEASAEP